jgi:SAM-dependent methyltransferase
VTKRRNRPGNAGAWGVPDALNYFHDHRLKTEDVYPSEWFFLKDKLKEGVSVLDIGCAQGGFASIISENIRRFSYTGVDINQRMIDLALEKFPQHTFHKVDEADLSILNDTRFDLVLCLGILHLHEVWRETLALAWQFTKGNLIFDLRETEEETVEDKAISYFRTDFSRSEIAAGPTVLPYNIINAVEAFEVIESTFADAGRIEQRGYRHGVSEFAVSPYPEIITRTWQISR